MGSRLPPTAREEGKWGSTQSQIRLRGQKSERSSHGAQELRDIEGVSDTRGEWHRNPKENPGVPRLLRGAYTTPSMTIRNSLALESAPRDEEKEPHMKMRFQLRAQLIAHPSKLTGNRFWSGRPAVSATLQSLS
jgi:hypothetical protein